MQTIIEFTHRASSGIDLALLGILLAWAFRVFPKHHPPRLGAVLSTVFLISEALIGAALVLLGHVAANPSSQHGISLTVHLVNTLTLIACLTLTAWWGTGKPPLRIAGRPAWMAAISAAAVMLLGISGVIAAFGDTLFPARSLAAGLAQDLEPAANIFVRLRLLHPVIAAATAVWLAAYGVGIATRTPAARPFAWAMLGVLMLQIMVGAANLLLLAPVWIQMIHLLLADLLWISLILTAAVTLQGAE